MSEIIPVCSGQHTVRVRIFTDDGRAPDGAISGDFAPNHERDPSESARHSGLSLAWQGTSGTIAERSSQSRRKKSHYAGSLLLTVVGSIISALTGLAIRELPSRLRSSIDAGPKAEVGPQ